MRALILAIVVCIFLILFPNLMNAGTSPCSATNYQFSDFGITKTYTLDNGTYMDLPDPTCGDYQGQDFWVTFTGPSSGFLNVELLDGSITDAAFEVYWNACNGLATSVGCFADRNCGSEPMPGANLQVIPGETYHIRIYQEGGGGGTIGFRMSDLGGTEFALAGSAQPFDSGNPLENCIQLTEELNNQVGCAWFETPIDFASGFEINYQLYFGDIDGAGADGIAFVFHTDATPPCSSAGGQLGVVGIPNSFIVEFDTWTNGNYGDNIPDDHVAINLDGFLGVVPFAPPVSIGTNGNVEDGEWHDVILQWDPTTGFFQVYFDGELKINVDVSLITDIFVAGTPVYWGLTGSTGGAYNNQIFCFEGFTVENTNSVENNIEAKICDGQPYVFGTDVLFDEGEYTEVYPAANGCDSTVTLNLEIVSIDISGIEDVVLPCGDDGSVVQLSALVESNVDEAFLSFDWNTVDGVIDSGENTLTPIVSAVGTYTLTVESNPEDCQNVFSIDVSIAEPPIVEAQGGFVACNDTITLSCNSDPGVEVSWSTTDGNIIGDPDVPFPMVDTAGTYLVTVTDMTTGCTSTSEAFVEGPGEGDAGPDLFYCIGENGEVSLQGSVSDDVVGFEWFPPNGLSDPKELTPKVLDLLQDTLTYGLVVCNRVGQNLVTNGDFADGISDFTTDYDEGVAAPGKFIITDDPRDFFPSFANCDNHSFGDENMMIVDGSVQANQNIWCQEIQVEDGLDYIASAWFTYVCTNCASNFPEISFTVNGASANTPELVDAPACEWLQLESDVFTAVGTTVEICIQDLELGSNGNDFGIDDIELYQVCKTSGGECKVIPYEEINVQIAPAEIACQEDQILDLDASLLGTDPNTVTWTWETLDGSIVSDSDSSTPTVQGAGTYSVTIVDDNTGCRSIQQIIIEEGNPQYPDFEIVANPITCFDNSSTAIIENLDPNITYDISWDGDASGFIDNGDGTIDVSIPGSYSVTVTNTENNCETIDDINIPIDNEIPIVEIESIPILTCNDIGQQIDLTGSFSSSGNTVVSWLNDAGEAVGSEDITSVEVTEGTFTFIVINTGNGCENQASITLEIDETPPTASILTPSDLDCTNPIANIQIDIPTGSDYSYAWASNNISFDSSQDSDLVEASGSGMYEVIVTDNITGCTTLLSTAINENFEAPSYTLATPDLLDCINDQVSISIDGLDLNYEWLANNDIISALNGNSVTVTGEGQYEVIITNNITGCTEIESIPVTGDFSQPEVEAGAPLTFGCTDISLPLLGSSTTSNTTAEWQTAGGIILGGQNSFEPSIGGAGTYYLTVTGENGCTSRDSVIISADTDLPTIAAPETIVLNCNSPTASIDASGSSNGTDFTFEWQDSNGNVISSFNSLEPTVSEAGQYQLTIINTQNNCDASTIVNVEEDFDPPMPNITPVTDLSCNETSSTFGIELNNPDWSYSWSDENGIISGADQFQFEASEIGAYTLSIVNESNGCSNEFPFVLNSSADIPTISIAGPDELSCLQSEIAISVNTNANNPTYSWFTSDGNILMSSTESDIQLNEPGTYAVTITDSVNGCSVDDTFLVTLNADVPVIEISEPVAITCIVDEVLIIATVDNIGQDVDFIWSTNDGILSSPNGAANISASSAGEYVLTVVNNENGCENTSTINVDESISTFLIDIEDPADLDCDITEIDLSLAPVSGTSITYTWMTPDGNIVDGADSVSPTINQAGEYTVLITDQDNGCTAQGSVIVDQDGNLPEIVIASPEAITCTNGQVNLDATGSSDGVDFLTTWTTIDGSILSGENGLTAEVDLTGTYTLSITNLTNNCEIEQDVFVEVNIEDPDVEILPFNDIDCDNPSVQVSTSIVSGNTNLNYQWSSTNGAINGASDQESIEAVGIGDYSLVVTNPENGCISEYTFAIDGNENVPQVSIISPNNIDCDNNNINVSLDLSADPQNLSFSWSTLDGMILGDMDDFEIQTNMAGTYEVTVTDIQSNCEVVLSATVEDIAEVPDLEFIQPNIITCAESSAVINTQTVLNGLVYTWSTLDGSISSALNGEDAIVTSAGTYNLTVFNPANNCENSITVDVFEDIEIPTVDLQPALELNCLITEQSLSADGSSEGNEFIYQWTSQSGQIVSGNNTLFPLINAPGYYTLEITNTENECTQLDSILISENTLQPLAQINMPQDLDCLIDIVAVNSDITNTDDLILEWTTVGGNIISDPSETSIEVDMPGVYELEITDTSNGCDNLLTATVEQNIDTPTLELNPGFTLTCDVSEGALSIAEIDPNAAITWMDSQMNMLSNENSINVSEPGIYTAVALFANTGCETVRTVEILRNENVPTELLADVEPALCFGDLARITIIDVIGGEGPYLYSTDGGQSFGELSTLDEIPAGTVTEVIVQDVNGCLLPTEFSIPNLLDTEANLPPFVELDLGDEYQIQVQTNIPTIDIESIIWTPNTGLSCIDCLNPMVSPTSNINYQVEITTTNGCSELADIQLRVDREINVYIPNAFSPFNGDGINDRFFIFAKEGVVANVQSLQVYDRWGNELFINEDFAPNEATFGWDGEFRQEKMQAGVYVYYAIVEYFDGTTELFKGDFTLME